MEDLSKLNLDDKTLEELEALRVEFKKECEELSKKLEEIESSKRVEFSSKFEYLIDSIDEYYFNLLTELRESTEDSSLLESRINRLVVENKIEIEKMIQEVKKI